MTIGGCVVIEKHLVLITPRAGDVIAQELSRGEFKVWAVPTFDAAMALVRGYHKLCLVVIDGAIELEHAEQFFRNSFSCQHSLPIIWISDSSSDFSRVVERVPLGPRYYSKNVPSSQELIKLLNNNLRSSSYNDEFVTCLTSSAVQSLKGFRMVAEPHSAYLSACRVHLSELNAVLSFSGQQAAGHLIVRGSGTLMHRSTERILKHLETPVTQAQLADMLGELANRILGLTLAFFEKRGTPVQFGLPVYVDGHSGPVWDERHVSTLGIEFRSPDGTLTVECSLAKLGEPTTSNSSRIQQLLDSEDGTLFL